MTAAEESKALLAAGFHWGYQTAEEVPRRHAMRRFRRKSRRFGWVAGGLLSRAENPKLGGAHARIAAAAFLPPRFVAVAPGPRLT